MNRSEEARAIADQYGLNINIRERDQPGEFEVGIVDSAGDHTVYWSTERTWVVYSEPIANEALAFDKVVELLILEKERRRLFADHPRPGALTRE